MKQNLSSSSSLALVTLALLACAVTTQAADPGGSLTADATTNDQKPGSVLVYNFYSSGVVSGNSHNTSIKITNTHTTRIVTVRFYFISQATGTFNPNTIGDAYICLIPNQTATFLASDIDRGTTGHMVAIATDLIAGCPISFNYLLGSESINHPAGLNATLNAQSIAALYSGTLGGCGNGSVTATLNFDGAATGYDRVPRTLVVDKLGSRADGNDSWFVLNRFGGNLQTGIAPIGFFKGTLFDDQGGQHEFTQSAGRQIFSILSRQFPSFDNSNVNFETILSGGRRGWMKIWATNDYGLFGAVINANPNGQSRRAAFNGGQNLRVLTLTNSVSLTIPLFQPSC